MIAGDHIYSPRTGYTHHGIYIGNGKVIHYSGFADGMKSGDICIATLEEFGNGNSVETLERPFRLFNHKETVERAHSRLGEDNYSLLFNNCEHFVNWCINGIHESEQVNIAKDIFESLANSQNKNLLPIQDKKHIPTTVPTSISQTPNLNTIVSTTTGIATGLAAVNIIAESLSSSSSSNATSDNISDTVVEIVDNTTEYLGETVEEIGNVIDSAVTGAIDFIGSIFD